MSAPGAAAADEGYFSGIFRRERDDIRSSCSRTDADGNPRHRRQYYQSCAESLFHGKQGLYVSLKSLPPQNGFAYGAVFRDNRLATPNWRLSYQADGQVSINSSYSAGLLFRMQRTTPESEARPAGDSPLVLDEFGRTGSLLFNVYAFRASLQRLYYFGLGPSTQVADRTLFAFDENVAGVSADYPVVHGLHLLGEINGRWPNVNGLLGQSHPSIEQRFDESTAPGLTRQPPFVQFGQGLQYLDNFAGRVAVNYEARFQQFLAPSDPHYQFRRLRLAAVQEFYPFQRFHPQVGSIVPRHIPALQLRASLVESIAGAGRVVPFYFQPTLGGGDIDKQRTLPSFLDYRFRAPNALFFRAQYEQPFPRFDFLGFLFRYDTGKVALRRDDIDLAHFRHSFSAGLTLRAGRFPYVTIVYSWGGGDGQHTFVDVNLSAISSSGGPAPLW